MIADDFKEDQVYSVPQIAEIAHVARGTVINWIKNGTLKATKPSKKFIIKGSDIIDFLNKSEFN